MAPRTTQKSKSTSNGAARQTTSSSKLKTTKSKKAAGEVVERVRSRSGEATVIDENGVRRSTRQRFAPLEYWRGERIRYGRPSLPTGTTPADLRGSQHAGEDEFEDDPSMMFTRKRVPVLDVKEVIRIPRAPGEGTFSGTTRVRTTSRSKVDRKSEERTPRLDSLTPDPAQTPDPLDDWSGLDPTADTIQVEDGWDSKTRRTGVVIDEDEGKEMEMDVVRTKASLRPVAAANQQFRFEKLFNCGGLMATGVLYLPPESRKPTKPSQDNNFVFCVLQGAIRATVHRKSFIVGPHGIFQVPSGNTYALENICSRDVHLFFAQCRKTKKANAGDLTTFTQMSDTSHTPRALLRGLGVEYVDRDERELSEQEPYYDEAQESEGYDSREGDYAQPHNKRSKSTSARAPAQAQMYSTDSDAEFSDEDDFELSQVKTKKKRKFRKI
uniref:CENP-C homolog n=1 Tax=Kalmanozyma brasiliensis (strain GHG001) TaxID=1365824 RepID=V5F0Q7_KALBG